MADNLKITEQVNKLLKDRAVLMKRMEETASRQIALQKKLCAAMEACAESAGEVEEEVQNVTDSLGKGRPEQGRI